MNTDNQRYTITLSPELFSLLKNRAELNHRSINKEITYLIEAALATEIDGNLQIMRMLMKAQGPDQKQDHRGG